MCDPELKYHLKNENIFLVIDVAAVADPRGATYVAFRL